MKTSFKKLATTILLCLPLITNAKYTLTSSDVTVKRGAINSCTYDFSISDIVIPEQLDGQKVTGIAKSVFLKKGITSIVLPTTISYIGDSAFAKNKIKKLDLSNYTALVTIGKYAFASNEIGLLNLSNCTALKTIGEYAFSDNIILNFILPVNTEYAKYGWLDDTNVRHEGGAVVNNLSSIYYIPPPYTLTDDDVVVHEGLIHYCSYNFLYTNIIIPETLDDQKVVGIADNESNEGVFKGKDITTLVLPATIETIGSYAFNHCSKLKDLDLTACTALTTIGAGAFYRNNLTKLDLSSCPALTTIDKEAFSKSYLNNINFSNCEALTSIGEDAFNGNKLTELYLSPCTALSTIEKKAFYSGLLENINFSNCASLTYIGEEVFSLNRITQVDLSDCSSLIVIDKEAFYPFKFSLPTNSEYEPQGWKDETGNEYLCGEKISDARLMYYVSAPYTLSDDDVVVINGNIETCTEFLFKNIIIPPTLDGQTVTGILNKESISGVFQDKDIYNINLPTTVNTIGESAFYGNKIADIDLSLCTSLSYIGEKAFMNNPISSFQLPSPNIPGYVFSNWIDGNSNAFNGGDVVSDLSTSYAADINYVGLNLRFTVTDGTNPIPNAIVTISTFEMAETNAAGIVIFPGLEPGTEIPYSIYATGYEPDSGTVMLNSDMNESIILNKVATGISKNSEMQLKLYPNPTSKLLNFQITEDASVSIMDIAGRLVLSQKINKGHSTISTAHLKTGCYFVKVETETNSFTRKLVKK